MLDAQPLALYPVSGEQKQHVTNGGDGGGSDPILQTCGAATEAVGALTTVRVVVMTGHWKSER